MIDFVPKFFTNRAIAVYCFLLLAVPIIAGHPMHWYWWLFGLIEVAGFFYFTNALSNGWKRFQPKYYEKTLFRTSWGIRTVYVIVSWLFYYGMNGVPFEFSAADSMMYDSVAREGADMIISGSFNSNRLFAGLDLSDRGYPLFLSIIYALSGKSVLIARLVKALLSAFSVVLMYRLAVRNFGEETGRVTAVICMLMPNLIYYCGLHLKETEMLFLTVLFIERADFIFRSKAPRIFDIVFLILVGVSTFFFRAVLCYVLFLTLIASVVFGSKRIKKGGKWAIESLILILVCILSVGQIGSDFFDAEEYQDIRGQQTSAMEFRSIREGGNAYARYASASIFAPLIFTIPFPTMVNIEVQQNQQMIHGGNFVKNITSFFTILAFIMLLFGGEWRDYVLPMAFVCGYLLVLAFSNFAQSERFHIPSLPFELMFASYAVTHFKAKYKNWFTVWLVFIFIVNIGWSVFKLRGRGL